jgi:nucleotide-binding universal stress UspA family protein
MTGNTNRSLPAQSRERGYDRVLVPTDGSACARAGVRHGVRIAKGVGATVHAVHVVNVGSGLPSLELPNSSGTDEQRAAGQESIDEVAEYGEEAGVDVVTELVDGRPAAALQDYLADTDIDFVAMGTRGRSNIERHLLGSVTQRLVRTSPVPVMTVGTEAAPDTPADWGYNDLLLPTRGGDGAQLAIDHAVSLAARFDATLHVLYVVDIRSQAAKHDAYELDSLTDMLRSTVTDEVINRASEAGVDARAVVQQGSPHSAIQRYVDKHGVDIVVMGTHGRGRVERFLLGSITERTIRTTDVPVVTVRLDEWFDADPGDDPS